MDLYGDIKTEFNELLAESANVSVINLERNNNYDPKKNNFSNSAGQILEKRIMVMCAKCKQRIPIFEYKVHLEQHRRNDHVGPAQIDTSNGIIPDHGALVIPTRRIRVSPRPIFGKDPYKCILCKKLFHDNASYKIHFGRLHPSLDPLKMYDYLERCETRSQYVQTDSAYETNSEAKQRLFSRKTSFKCIICKKAFYTNVNYEKHFQRYHRFVHRSKIYSYLAKCETANRNIPKDDNFQESSKLVERSSPSLDAPENAKKELIACRKFEQNFPDASTYEDYQKSHHSDVDPSEKNVNFVQCAACNRYFATDKGLRRHNIIIHRFAEPKSKSKIGCRKCEQSISEISNYEAHWKQNHSDIDPLEMYDDPVRCEICNRYFPTEKGLRRHTLLIHHMDGCKSKTLVHDRKQTHHLLRATRSRSCIFERVLLGCRKCDVSFTEILPYEKHWKSFHYELDAVEMYKNPIQCKICTRYFPNEDGPNGLSSHIGPCKPMDRARDMHCLICKNFNVLVHQAAVQFVAWRRLKICQYT